MTDVELGDLGLDEGGHLLIKRVLTEHSQVRVFGTAPSLAVDLPAWCRAHGHTWADGIITRGDHDRWRGAERAGTVDAAVEQPSPQWGLAARGSLVEAGVPELDLPPHTRDGIAATLGNPWRGMHRGAEGFDLSLARKRDVWADEAERLYAQAVASQWDPATAIPWDAPISHTDDVEDAIVQLMTYLIENETAALLVPVRFLGRLHPQFREVMQLLAVQAADEARHIEVFTRRATLRRHELGLSTAGGQASLATLFDEPEFAVASFLLSVLGEGSFLSLLWFIRDHAPDACTRDVARLAAQDEARHVAFGLAHLGRHIGEDPSLRGRLAAAIERRHAALAHTSGLNAEVFDALVLLAAGSWQPAALRRGHAAVVGLVAEMDNGRRNRLMRLGFAPDEAAALSALHTRNFM